MPKLICTSILTSAFFFLRLSYTFLLLVRSSHPSFRTWPMCLVEYLVSVLGAQRCFTQQIGMLLTASEAKVAVTYSLVQPPRLLQTMHSTLAFSFHIDILYKTRYIFGSWKLSGEWRLDVPYRSEYIYLLCALYSNIHKRRRLVGFSVCVSRDVRRAQKKVTQREDESGVNREEVPRRRLSKGTRTISDFGSVGFVRS